MDALVEALASETELTIDIVRRHYFRQAQLQVMRDELEMGDKAINDLMTATSFTKRDIYSEDSSTSNEIDKDRRTGIRKLKPGETTPSHRQAAASLWSGS